MLLCLFAVLHQLRPKVRKVECIIIPIIIKNKDDDDDDVLEPQSFLIELIVLTPSALWLDYLKTNIR